MLQSLRLAVDLCGTASIPLPARLRLKVVLLDRLAALERRKIKLVQPALQALPPPIRIAIRPDQRAHPRLHVPMQVQRRIAPLRDLARHVRDLVFRFLVVEAHDARTGARGVGLGLFACLVSFGFGGRFGRRVDVRVLVEGRVVGRYYRVPDDDL